MIQARAWPVRAMYILIAAALAISLFITAAPAQKVSGANNDVAAEWTRVPTPTTEDWLLAPESIIIDYALADGGDVAYAVVYAYDEDCSDSSFTDMDYRLLKSDDGAATWTDITDALEDELATSESITELVLVATDWEDPDFVAVALALNVTTVTPLHVFISIDGGETFVDAEEVEDGGVYLTPYYVSDLAVSYEDDGEREIAIGGAANGTPAARLFRCTVDGDNPGNWEDATDYAGDYQGWDDNGSFNSTIVTDIIFSYSWETDRTILVVTATNESAGNCTGYRRGDVYLQSGVWGATSAAWNEYATFAPAVSIIENVDIPYWLMDYDARAIAGVALPEDYSGDDPDSRYAWVWVNYYDGAKSLGKIFRVIDDTVYAVDTQISKTPWLTNVSYLGTIAEGKAIAGLLAESATGCLYSSDLDKECCKGVQVYRNDGVVNMEICCLEWDKACKPPTGRFAMAVSYVSDDKAYAVALGGVYSYEEGAWSVSFDDGDTWNQLSLIDTYIDYLSDVAVSPDCNKMMLVSVNLDKRGCGCDSVWLYADTLPEAEEYSDHWLRTWCGSLEGDWWEWDEGGLLRLAPEETTGDTVYLVDIGTATVYYNDMETLACWQRGTATVDDIVDLAVLDEATIYALDWYGDVAMSDDHGKTLTWTDPVDSEIETKGWSIAVHGEYVLVGSAWNGEVSYCDDFLAEEPEFTVLDETVPIDCSNGHTTVAFDTYFDENNTIYAAIEGWGSDMNCDYSCGGIYLWVMGESEEWTDTDACHDLAYTGIVQDRPSPANPYTSPETGGVLYASYVYWEDCEDGDWYETGVARCLQPIVEICCDAGEAEWDYLRESDPEGWFYGSESVGFEATPDALKICGCLDATSNSKLFAIDMWGAYYGSGYDMCDGEVGTVWTFEDCYAKKAIELTSPVDGFVVPADPCECDNSPFTLKWDRLCDSCCYEFEFALDEDFTELVSVEQWAETPWWQEMVEWFIEYFEIPIDGGLGMCDMTACYLGAYCPKAPTSPSMWVPSDGTFTCEFTYYWRVRAVSAETGQCIRSWWSEPQSFTIAPSAAAGVIDLVSPVPGATGVAVKNVGFSWDLTATADAFDWVLSANADLSAPVDTKTGLTSTACTYTGTLSYGTTYYWQVTAYNDGAAISTSAVGTFTTAPTGAFCCPIDGLCFATQAELQAHNAAEHPAQPATPFWVWVVIAIGAVLVIVVIVLIFRTRRV